MSSGEPRFGIVEQLRSAAGEDRWLQTNKVPLRDLDGRIIGVLGTFEDITNRRRAEEELQRALDELDGFLGDSDAAGQKPLPQAITGLAAAPVAATTQMTVNCSAVQGRRIGPAIDRFGTDPHPLVTGVIQSNATGNLFWSPIATQLLVDIGNERFALLTTVMARL